MGEQSPESASSPTGAVFLSYASQDAEPAKRICDALRAAGIEVWFDQSELRGGDAWDQSIRKQIKSCALFVPIISKHTHERAEGYFRLEWKLAVDRSHLITAHKAFLVPVVIDDTADDEEHVPDKFREVQWTRLPAGLAPPEFVTRVRQLLSGDAGHSPTFARASTTAPLRRSTRPKPAWIAVAVAIAALATYLVAERPWTVKPALPSKLARSADASVAFNPPPHSIAVLPFVNMSGDKEQEYFSDGLTEELLNSLSRINELRVAGRTSSFYFKGKDVDFGTIARKLNVGAVLEGSVRRSGQTVRVTAQLINAVNGIHVWSQTYDQDMGDALRLQTDVANAVAGVLKVTLLGDAANKIKLGGTRDPAAYDAYLRASTTFWQQNGARDLEEAIASYEKAAQLDPAFGLAFADWSIALTTYADAYATGPAIQDWLRRARKPALNAIAVAPDLDEGHLALAIYLVAALDFTRADEEFERALALGPGNARVLRNYGGFAVKVGHTEAGLAAIRRAVALDPLNVSNHGFLIRALYQARRYDESLTAWKDLSSFYPNNAELQLLSAGAYYGLGNFQKVRSLCEPKAPEGYEDWCRFWLALAYHKLGLDADAKTTLERLKALEGDEGAYDYAKIYAQWGDAGKALEWLGVAVRLRVLDLQELKAEPLLDPLRKEPRFQAIERELKFPN